ncbi:hypothetical protein [Spirochaeta cellobiosiphila]|uniref:hypothetical protein n=1 Tax=Spirochaeta cellobiosiphila TaxID=504483 RepID=UPI0003FBABFE|nr:hypothetical protein [Spirochaeta cellobiosiphila]
MKKIIIVFIIVTILSCTIFILGWINPYMIPNEGLVFYSKTSGIEKKDHTKERLLWRWQKVIPNNFIIYQYDISSYRKDYNYKGELPSAELYSQYSNSIETFKYSFDISLSLKPNSVKLYELTNLGITPDNLGTYLSNQLDILADRSADFVIRNYNNEADISSIAKRELISHMKKDLPYISVEYLSIKNIKMPDFELYNKIKTQYLSYLDTRKGIIDAQTETSIKQDIYADQLIDNLKKINGFIIENPKIMEFLQLKNDTIGKTFYQELLNMSQDL